jgi:hypothetical protein
VGNLTRIAAPWVTAMPAASTEPRSIVSGLGRLLGEGRQDAPDNLYASILGHDTAKNGFRALSRSLYNWLEMHPTVRRVATAGTVLGLIAALRRRL